MPKRVARKPTDAEKPDAEAAADADRGAATEPATPEADTPTETADAAAGAALRARDEAARVLGDARLRLATLERERERLADELAAGADARPAYAAAVLAVEEQSGIVRALTRRCDRARQDLAGAEAGLEQARKAVEAARLEAAWQEVEERADMIDAAVATLATELPKLLQACTAYDLRARQLHGPARLGVVAERATIEHALREQLTNILPAAFRVFPREQSTLLTVLEVIRRRRGAAYADPVVVAVPPQASPPAVVVDRSDPTGGPPDQGWLREQDRQTAEARRAAPEPLLR